MTDQSKETNDVALADTLTDEPPTQSETTGSMKSKSNSAMLVVVLILLVAFLLLHLHWVAAIPNYQAQLRFESRDTAAAEWWIDVAQTISPQNAESEYLLGRVRRRQGDLNGAEEHFNVARDLGFAREAVDRERQLVSIQRGNLPSDPRKINEYTIESPLESADIYESFVVGAIESHEYGLAGAWMNEWSGLHTLDPRPRYYQGKVAAQFQEWRQAEEAFRAALQLDTQFHKATLGLAEVLLATEQYEPAIGLFRSAQENAFERPAAMVGEATCLRMTGKGDRARELVKKVLAEKTEMKNAMIEMAYLELDDGNFDEARKLIAPHIAAESRDYDLNRAYAEALKGCDQNEQADKYFKIASDGKREMIRAKLLASLIAQKPKEIKNRYELGAIHLDFGSEQQGINWLLGVLSETPGHPQALKKLAEYYELKKDDSDDFARLARQYRERYEKSRTQEDENKAKSDDEKNTKESSSGTGTEKNKKDAAPMKKSTDE